MQYRIVGAYRNTGHDVAFVVDANDEAHAERVASAHGILTSEVSFICSNLVDDNEPLMIERYLSNTQIQLPYKLRSPGGSRITVVQVWIDIEFSIHAGRIRVHHVRLSQTGNPIGNSKVHANITSPRTGEAWYVSDILAESDLRKLVECDLEQDDSVLRKIMWGTWYDTYPGPNEHMLVDALNSQAPIENIEHAITLAGRGRRITFVYTKPNAEPTVRDVLVIGVSGRSLRALDKEDNQAKCFRIDRISEVEHRFPPKHEMM